MNFTSTFPSTLTSFFRGLNGKCSCSTVNDRCLQWTQFLSIDKIQLIVIIPRTAIPRLLIKFVSALNIKSSSDQGRQISTFSGRGEWKKTACLILDLRVEKFLDIFLIELFKYYGVISVSTLNGRDVTEVI